MGHGAVATHRYIGHTLGIDQQSGAAHYTTAVQGRASTGDGGAAFYGQAGRGVFALLVTATDNHLGLIPLMGEKATGGFAA